MSENFILRRIFEQNLEVYRNLQTKGRVKKSYSKQEVVRLTQQQLLLARPRVVLTRIDTNDRKESEKMHSSQNSLKKLLDGEDAKNIDLSDHKSDGDWDDMIETLLEIKKLLETLNHTKPFIDFSLNDGQFSNTIVKEVDIEREECLANDVDKNKDNPKAAETPTNNDLSESESNFLRDMATEAEILEMMESLIREENEKSLKTSSNSLLLNNAQEKVDKESAHVDLEKSPIGLRRGRRVRKPTAYDHDEILDLLISPPKKKKKSKPTSAAPKNDALKLKCDVLKIEGLPIDSHNSEVEIYIPENLSSKMKGTNLKIFVNLAELDLSQNAFVNSKANKKSKKTKNAAQEKSDLVKYLECFSTDCDSANQEGDIAVSVSSESPHNIISTTTTDNLQDQISTNQIEQTAPTFPTSNERGEWIPPSQFLVDKSLQHRKHNRRSNSKDSSKYRR